MKMMEFEGKVFVGGGTLQQFKKKYDEIDSKKGQWATASQLFPNGEKNVEGQMVYEFIIYHKVDPNRNKQINKSGRVFTRLVSDKSSPVEDKATGKEKRSSSLPEASMKNPLTEKDIPI